MRTSSILIPTITMSIIIYFAIINSDEANDKTKLAPIEQTNKTKESKRIVKNKPIATIEWTPENSKSKGSHSIIKLHKGKKIKTEHIVRQKIQPEFKRSIFKEKTVICRWTAGRMGKLIQTIKTGRKGKKSIFCEEYKKRKKELQKYKCNNNKNSKLMNSC